MNMTFTPIELMWLHPDYLSTLKQNNIVSIEQILDNPSIINILPEDWILDIKQTFNLRWITI